MLKREPKYDFTITVHSLHISHFSLAVCAIVLVGHPIIVKPVLSASRKLSTLPILAIDL